MKVKWGFYSATQSSVWVWKWNLTDVRSVLPQQEPQCCAWKYRWIKTESLKHLILKADWYGSLGMWYNDFFFQAIALNSAPVICDWDVFACSGSLTYLRLIGGFHPSLLMWLFISNCPISSWSQRITVVLTWLCLVPLFYRHIIVANWHQTRGTSGLQLVRSSWGLLLWGNGQGGERSHLCRWDVTLAPRIPVKWDLDKHASYVLSPDASEQEQKWVVFAVAVVCSCICSILELWTGALLC